MRRCEMRAYTHQKIEKIKKIRVKRSEHNKTISERKGGHLFIEEHVEITKFNGKMKGKNELVVAQHSGETVSSKWMRSSTSVRARKTPI